MRSPLVVLAAAGVIAAALPSSASAASWLPLGDPFPPSTGGEAFPVVSKGKAQVVWLDGDAVLAAQRGGGGWSTTVLADEHASELQVADGDDGRIEAVWSREIGGVKQVQYASYSPTGGWTTPIELDPGSADQTRPAVAYVAGGALVAWIEPAGGSWIVRAAEVAAATSTVQDLDTLATLPQPPTEVAATFGAAPTVAWIAQDAHNVVHSSTSENGAWITPEGVSPLSEDAADLDLGADSAGKVTAVWTGDDGSSKMVKQATRVSGAWLSPQSFGGSITDASPVLGVGADGTTVVAWVGSGGNSLGVKVRLPGNDWLPGQATFLTAFGEALSPPSVDVNASGEAIVVWGRATDESVRVARYADGAWIATESLADAPEPAEGVRADIEDDGTAIASWELPGGAATEVGASVIDAGEPTLGAIHVPAVATVGAPVNVSASASDHWSSTSYSWDFGDGTAPANGDAASHTYTAAGTYTVRAIATDSNGNSTAFPDRAITVSAVPTPEPPAPTPTPTPTPTPEPPAPTATPTPTPTPPAGGGQKLTGLVPVTSVAKPLLIKPTAKLELGCQLIADAVKRCTVDIFATPKGGVTTSRVHGKLVGRATVNPSKPELSVKVRVKLNGAGRRMLRRHKAGLTLSVRSRATSTASATLRTTDQLRVKLAKRR